MARTGNLIEGILWVVIGVCFLIALVRRGQATAKIVAGVNFIAFGISDFVEMHTGAWWRPLWLLVWKGGCILVMVLLLVQYMRRKRTAAVAEAQGRTPRKKRGLAYRLTMSVLRILVVAYVGLGALLFFGQSWIVYRPHREMELAPPTGTYEEVTLQAADGTKLSAWYFPVKDARNVVLFCHGNAGNMSHRLLSVYAFQDMGLSVLIFDYRGYGDSEGNPSEGGTQQDARAAWDYLVKTRKFDPGRIVLFGRSLGGAVAGHLAGEVTPGALILESTFTSVPDLGWDLYPYLPIRLLCRFSYDTRSVLARVNCPVLVVHSRDDDMIPFSHGQALFEAAKGPKEFLRLSGSHNDSFLSAGKTYTAGLKAFLDKHMK